jgi:hypothetical protein
MNAVVPVGVDSLSGRVAVRGPLAPLPGPVIVRAEVSAAAMRARV